MTFRPPDRRRSLSLLGLAGLLLAAGCVAPAGTSIDDPRAVAQQVDARYDALDEYQATIERTVSVGGDAETETTRATVRFVKGESLRIAYRTGPRAGTETVVDDPSPSELLTAASSPADESEAPASYGAFAGRLVETHNVTYRGSTVVGDRPAVVLSLEPTNESGAAALPTERLMWIDAERRVPLRVESTWERGDRTVRETVRFANTSLSVTNATDAPGGVAA